MRCQKTGAALPGTASRRYCRAMPNMTLGSRAHTPWRLTCFGTFPARTVHTPAPLRLERTTPDRRAHTPKRRVRRQLFPARTVHTRQHPPLQTLARIALAAQPTQGRCTGTLRSQRHPPTSPTRSSPRSGGRACRHRICRPQHSPACAPGVASLRTVQHSQSQASRGGGAGGGIWGRRDAGLRDMLQSVGQLLTDTQHAYEPGLIVMPQDRRPP